MRQWKQSCNQLNTTQQNVGSLKATFTKRSLPLIGSQFSGRHDKDSLLILSKSNMNHSWGGTAQKKLGNFGSYPVVFDMPNPDRYFAQLPICWLIGLIDISNTPRPSPDVQFGTQDGSLNESLCIKMLPHGQVKVGLHVNSVSRSSFVR